MNYKFEKTNYDDIKNKSVWDLYVENFRDHLFDLCPSIGFLSSTEEEVQEEPSAEPSEDQE